MFRGIAKTTRVNSLLEMKQFGSALAKDTMKYLLNYHQSDDDDVNMHALLLLSGEAGIGKTTFAQGFIAECIVRGNSNRDEISSEDNTNIPSPTFCLINEYWCKTLKIPINHMDLYRLEHSTKDVLETIDIPHIFNDSISLVEWPDRLFYAGIKIPLPYVNVHFEYNIENKDGEKQNHLKGNLKNFDLDFSSYQIQERIVTIDENLQHEELDCKK